jgi:hypothetical protein
MLPKPQIAVHPYLPKTVHCYLPTTLVYYKSNKGLIAAMDFSCMYPPTDKFKIWLSFFRKKIKF